METSVNNKCRSFTSLEQSKKLEEFLPIESADMHYNNVSIRGINYVDDYRAELMDYNTSQKVLSKYFVNPMFEIIPCWSLVALLNFLPANKFEKEFDGKWWFSVYLPSGQHKSHKHDNPIDACVEIILNLHKLNLL